jgi:hypothetical protein
MAFSRFMAQPIGRIIKAVLGLVLVAAVFPMFGGTMGGTATGMVVVGVIGVHHVVALIGLALIALGAFNLCPIAPFVGGYFNGRKHRSH